MLRSQRFSHSVVDAQADTWGESGRRMVAQVEVWFAAVVAAVITPQQLTVAAAIVARTHVAMYAILTGEPSLSPESADGERQLPAMGAFSSRINPRPGQDMRRELVEVRGKGARGDNSHRRSAGR